MVENILGISAHDYELALLYHALIERYEQVAPHRAPPMMAVRLMAERVDFDAILKGLELYGVPWAAERCRYEMTARQEFFARMVAKSAGSRFGRSRRGGRRAGARPRRVRQPAGVDPPVEVPR